MWTFGWSWTRLCCYAEHVVGWRCERSVEVEHASAATLIMWWGGDVNVRLKLNTPLLLRWSSFAVEHATHGTLSMWWGDVNVRLQLNTPLLLRWACGGGVEMWTFGWSWTRLCCYADHGVGWGGDVNVRLQLNTPRMLRWACDGDVNVRLKLNTPLLLRWSCGGVEMWTFGWSWLWGGVGMLTFVCSWTRHACYAEHVLGWRCERSVEVEHASAATLIMWWGGDVNVRLKLNTPLLLRWSWGGVGWGC